MDPTNLRSSSYKPQNAKPEIKEIVNFLSSISARWYEIGVSLGVDSNDLEGLYRSNDSKEVKLSKVVQKWLEKAEAETASVTWDEINRVKSSVASKPPPKPGMYFITFSYFCSKYT